MVEEIQICRALVGNVAVPAFGLVLVGPLDFTVPVIAFIEIVGFIVKRKVGLLGCLLTIYSTSAESMIEQNTRHTLDRGWQGLEQSSDTLQQSWPTLLNTGWHLFCLESQQ